MFLFCPRFLFKNFIYSDVLVNILVICSDSWEIIRVIFYYSFLKAEIYTTRVGAHKHTYKVFPSFFLRRQKLMFAFVCVRVCLCSNLPLSALGSSGMRYIVDSLVIRVDGMEKRLQSHFLLSGCTRCFI